MTTSQATEGAPPRHRPRWGAVRPNCARTSTRHSPGRRRRAVTIRQFCGGWSCRPAGGTTPRRRSSAQSSAVRAVIWNT